MLFMYIITANMYKKNKNNEYYCKVCEYTTINKTNFSKHLMTSKHKKNIKKKDSVICDGCGKIFTKRGIKYHWNNVCEKKLLKNTITTKFIPLKIVKCESITEILENAVNRTNK